MQMQRVELVCHAHEAFLDGVFSPGLLRHDCNFLQVLPQVHFQQSCQGALCVGTDLHRVHNLRDSFPVPLPHAWGAHRLDERQVSFEVAQCLDNL
jgi:hypothetical protein